MALPKSLAGILAFAVALAAAILVTKYYATPDPPPTPPSPAAPSPAPTVESPSPPAPPAAVGATQLSFKPQMVTLDLAAKQSHTTLAVERDPARPLPEKIWVRTYFFSTEAKGKIWSGDAVEIQKPFAGGGSRANVNVTAACAWCGDGRAPRGGYYARVVLSAESKEATRVSDDKVDTNISTATPVVVQEGAGGRR